MAGFRIIRTRRSEAYMRNILSDAYAAMAAYARAGWLDDPRLGHADPGHRTTWR